MKGEIVKSLIISKGYNVAQVAELIGTSQQNLASALKHTDIRTGLLEQIAEAMNVPLSYFYGESFGPIQTATGNHNTQVSGSGNTVTSDGAFLEYVRVKDEQLTMAMKQTSKAQEQMDEVLRLFRKPAESVEDGDQ